MLPKEETMFTDKQNQLLKYNLDGKRVKTRQQGNISLSYLEGYDIIDTANFAFGFGNWSYKVTQLEQVSEELNQNQNKVIGYKAIVAVTVYDLHHKATVTREDVGFGTGIARDYASAHESGAKEAVTDALKRAFRTFGNQFGNALYDKSQKNVDHTQQPRQIPQNQSPQPQPPQNSQDPYAPLRQLGLDVVQQNGELVVTGSTYGKQQTIKGLGFRWDASRKVWYQEVQEAA
jgi:DNA repair and recombination protein RAD52